MITTYSFRNIENSLSVNEAFKYNFYDESEISTDDSVIINNDFNSSKKNITLDIQYKQKYTAQSIKVLEELNTEILDELASGDIENNAFKNFNNAFTENRFDNYVISNPDLYSSFFDKVFRMNNTNNNSSNIEFAKNSKKIGINKRFIKSLSETNRNNIFYDFDLDIFDTKTPSIDNNIDNDVGISLIKLGKVTKNYKSYNRKVINENTRTHYSFVGFLVLKYEKADNEYKLNSKKFFKDSAINDVISEWYSFRSIFYSLLKTKSFRLEDIAVSYGKTYRYAVYPVINYTLPAYEDYWMLEDFLVCDCPLFTEDIVCKENIRPLPPSKINFFYSDNEDKLRITWSSPAEPSGDIKGYQIFKRQSFDSPYTLLKQFESHSESDFYTRNINVLYEDVVVTTDGMSLIYHDDSFEKSKTSIYTLCSIDAHGFVSNYSEQIAIRYDFAKKEIVTDLISRVGAPLHMPNLLIPRKTKFFNNDDKIVSISPLEEDISKITIYATPELVKYTVDDSEIHLFKENYRFNIFMLENKQNYIDKIEIKNFLIVSSDS
jgi:hypothetical protein